jgi:hypothetical protein
MEKPPEELLVDEALGVVTVRNRRVVLLSNPVQQPRGAPRQDFVPSHLVCPMYRFHDTHSTAFRLRVQAWEYEWLFHLPASDEFGIVEGFLRLDRVVVVPVGQLRLTDVMLNSAFGHATQTISCSGGEQRDREIIPELVAARKETPSSGLSIPSPSSAEPVPLARPWFPRASWLLWDRPTPDHASDWLFRFRVIPPLLTWTGPNPASVRRDQASPGHAALCPAMPPAHTTDPLWCFPGTLPPI